MLTEPSYAPQDRTPEVALTSKTVAEAINTLRAALMAEYGTDFAFQVHGKGGVIGASTKGYGNVGPFWNPATEEVDPDDDEQELWRALLSEKPGTGNTCSATADPTAKTSIQTARAVPTGPPVERGEGQKRLAGMPTGFARTTDTPCAPSTLPLS